MVIVVFAFLARVLARHAAVVIIFAGAVAGAAVTGAFLPLDVARVFTTTPTTIAAITTIGIVAITL